MTTEMQQNSESYAFANQMRKSTARGSLVYWTRLTEGTEDFVLAQVARQTEMDAYLANGKPSWMQRMARMVMSERCIEA